MKMRVSSSGARRKLAMLWVMRRMGRTINIISVMYSNPAVNSEITIDS